MDEKSAINLFARAAAEVKQLAVARARAQKSRSFDGSD
jgi:hypothetical protein